MRLRPHGGGDTPATEGRPPRGLEHWSPHYRRVRAWRQPESSFSAIAQPRALPTGAAATELRPPVWRKEG